MSFTLPLSERMRPQSWDDVVGLKHLFDKKSGVLFRILKQKRPVSLVFFGPPGSGKTTLAQLYLKSFGCHNETVHSTTTQIQDLKKIIQQTEQEPLIYRPTILWIDEVHRLTKPQQDVLLPGLERGSIVLVAATTENPSFQLTRALLSRVQVVMIEPLLKKDLLELLERTEKIYGALPLTKSAREHLIEWASGDARALLNWLDQLLHEKQDTLIDEKGLALLLQKKTSGFDLRGEGRYQIISALHKAVRGSDCQSALYWFCRLLAAGEDVLYIARRVLRMATEDVGLADPTALQCALNALQTYERLGSPEGELAVAQAIIYLSLAPKSNSLYVAYNKAKEDAAKSTHLVPPKHIINAPTQWMKDEGFSHGYVYDHDLEKGFSGQSYWPDGFEKKEYYLPVERGFERELRKRLAYFAKLRDEITPE